MPPDKTKDGRPIIFRRVDHADDQRGWREDWLEAIVEGVVVGTLKIAYIPMTEWKRNYPSVFNFAALNGKCLHVGDTNGVHWKTLVLDEKEMLQLWRNAYLAVYGNWPEWRGANDPTADRLVEEITKLEALLAKKLSKEIAAFKKFHIDKPMVAWIEVPLVMRRQGIGAALYLEAAAWVAERSMKFYASGLQSKEAKGVWEALENRGLVGTDRRGRFIRIVDFESNKTLSSASYL